MAALRDSPSSVEDIQVELDRRRPGQSDITTHKESDTATIVSGFTKDSPSAPRSRSMSQMATTAQTYAEMKDKFRPSHADFTYQSKFGIRNHEGGGRSSARETIGRVAAEAIARKIAFPCRQSGNSGIRHPHPRYRGSNRSIPQPQRG